MANENDGTSMTAISRNRASKRRTEKSKDANDVENNCEQLPRKSSRIIGVELSQLSTPEEETTPGGLLQGCKRRVEKQNTSLHFQEDTGPVGMITRSSLNKRCSQNACALPDSADKNTKTRGTKNGSSPSGRRNKNPRKGVTKISPKITRSSVKNAGNESQETKKAPKYRMDMDEMGKTNLEQTGQAESYIPASQRRTQKVEESIISSGISSDKCKALDGDKSYVNTRRSRRLSATSVPRRESKASQYTSSHGERSAGSSQQMSKPEQANTIEDEDSSSSEKQQIISKKRKLESCRHDGEESVQNVCQSPRQENQASPTKRTLDTMEAEAQKKNDGNVGDSESWWDPCDPQKVSLVKAALHVSGANTGTLPICRERQVTAIDAWLAKRLQEAQGGSMYLSGLPGTGKSLTAFEIVRQCTKHATSERSICCLPPSLIGINCMRLTHPKDLVERIIAGYEHSCQNRAANDLIQVTDEEAIEFRSSPWYTANRRSSHGGTASSVNDALFALRQIVLQPLPLNHDEERDSGKGTENISASLALRKHRNSNSRRSSFARIEKGMIVVILDEMDGLLTGKHGEELIGGLFSLASIPQSRLILIGIANSIDLVQQLLRPGGPFHRFNLRPEHEVFPAYMRPQISDVLRQRLQKLPAAVFQDNCIEFCARKIANGAGDLRLALEAMALAVDAQVQEKNMETSVPIGNQNNINKLVGMRHMAKSLSQVTGGIGINNEKVATIQQLPVPQQLLMVVIAKLLGDTLQNRGLKLKLPSKDRRNSFAATNSHHFIGSGNGAVVSDLLPAPSMPSATFKTAHRRRSSHGTNSVGFDFLSRKDLTLGDIESAHAGLCKKVGVTQYNGSEFVTAAEMISTLGLVELVGKSDMRQKRVLLRVPEDDILMALADKPILKDIVGA